MDQKSYRPVIGDDNDYHIKEPSGGVYKSLKMIMLKSASTGMDDKLAVVKEFKLIKDLTDKEERKKFLDEINKEELGLEAFYEKIFSVLFIGAKNDVKFENLNLNQVNKAINDFFTSASGS